MYGLIFIFSLILIFFSLKQYKNICLNNYRDKLFSLRHELMLLTFSTSLSCDDIIYRYYEKRMNAHIRFAHTISFFKIIIYRFYIRKNKVNILHNKDFEKYQLSLLGNKELEDKIKDIDNRVADAFIVYLLTTSVLIWVYVMYKLLTTKSNVVDGKIDLGVKDKIDETIDILEEKDLGYILNYC